MSNSFAHVLCTTSSATTAIGTSAAYIFDTDHGSVAFSSNISGDITWDEDGGTFTFARAGVYHVIVNAITSQVTSNRLQTTTFHLNSDAAIYTAAPFIDKDMDPVEVTHQRIISIAAGDVLHIKTKTGANTMGIEKGTSVIIMEITSGVYASSTVTTSASNDTTDEFNPYDTDLSGGPVFATAGKIASGVTFTQTAGSMTVPSDGKYLIMVSNMFAAGGTTNSNITMKLKEGSNVLYTGASRLHSTTDPFEHTICVIEDLDASEVLTVTWDIGSGRCQAEKGATFTVYKLQEGRTTHTNPKRRGQDLYASVVNKATLTATAAEVNPFDEDSYSSADFDTRTSNGITFAAGDGSFTVSKPGLYFVMHNALITVAGDVVVTMKIKVNGVAQVTSDSSHVDSLDDPENRTIQGLLSLREGDVVSATIDANTAVNIGHDAGSHLTIFRYSPFSKARPVKASGRIKRDNSFDTFSIENLTAQYEGNADQVPFKLGGGLNLRGKTTAGAVTGGGKVKK